MTALISFLLSVSYQETDDSSESAVEDDGEVNRGGILVDRRRWRI